MLRLSLCFLLAELVGYAAHRAGVPFWRAWPPGDAHDWGAAVFLLAWYVSRPRRAA